MNLYYLIDNTYKPHIYLMSEEEFKELWQSGKYDQYLKDSQITTLCNEKDNVKKIWRLECKDETAMLFPIQTFFFSQAECINELKNWGLRYFDVHQCFPDCEEVCYEDISCMTYEGLERKGWLY